MNWPAWVWGSLCVLTWLLYAAEHAGFFTLDDLARWAELAWAWLPEAIPRLIPDSA